MTYIYRFNKQTNFSEISVTEQLHAKMYVYFNCCEKKFPKMILAN